MRRHGRFDLRLSRGVGWLLADAESTSPRLAYHQFSVGPTRLPASRSPSPTRLWGGAQGTILTSRNGLGHSRFPSSYRVALPIFRLRERPSLRLWVPLS